MVSSRPLKTPLAALLQTARDLSGVSTPHSAGNVFPGGAEQGRAPRQWVPAAGSSQPSVLAQGLGQGQCFPLRSLGSAVAQRCHCSQEAASEHTPAPAVLQCTAQSPLDRLRSSAPSLHPALTGHLPDSGTRAVDGLGVQGVTARQGEGPQRHEMGCAPLPDSGLPRPPEKGRARPCPFPP